YNPTRASARVLATAERNGPHTAGLARDPAAEMRDRLKASEILARASGDFIERVEHSALGGEPLTIRVIYGRGGVNRPG
ncbi:MAG: hypothetical protein ACK5X5_14205, partial [bacterium]